MVVGCMIKVEQLANHSDDSAIDSIKSEAESSFQNPSLDTLVSPSKHTNWRSGVLTNMLTFIRILNSSHLYAHARATLCGCLVA